LRLIVADRVPGDHRVEDLVLGDQRHANADLVAREDLLPLHRLAHLAEIDGLDPRVFPAPVRIPAWGEQLDELAVAVEQAALVLAYDDDPREEHAGLLWKKTRSWV